MSSLLNNSTSALGEKIDILIVGAGISGCVLAERYAKAGQKVLILEKRNHIGGNCYDFYNQDGILVSKYGPHLFHTNYEEVWEYLQQFAEWYPYSHKVVAKINDLLVPVPVNINTVNKIFNQNIQSEEEMKVWLAKNQVKNESPRNGKEAALARVGKKLYELIFKYYTKKQWDKYPEELDASVLQRIPVRDNFDDRYFTDKYQALPKGGYTQLFKKILDHQNIKILLNTDYFDVVDSISGYEKLFYTGPIDRYFEFKGNLVEKLEYRSLRFVEETYDIENFQSYSQINYPALDVPYTRSVEYKHITGQKHQKTTVVYEYSSAEGEPYYPVPNPRNDEIYQKFKDEADKLTNIYFVGRLANYKYFNMDQAFKNALDLFNKLENNICLSTQQQINQ